MEHFSTTAPMLTKALSSLLTCRYTIGGGRVVAEGQRHEPQGSELIDNIDERYLSTALKGTIKTQFVTGTVCFSCSHNAG